jgi:hypothetical protein
MIRLRTLIILLTCAWPLLLTAAVAGRVADTGPIWTTAVYLAAQRVCHQQPTRSLTTAGVQWPVCGRCAGLYLAAPIGVWLVAGRRRGGSVRGSAALAAIAPSVKLAVAAGPSLITWGLEWSGLATVTTATRLLAALPLGAAIGAILVWAAGSAAEPIRYTDRP